MKKGIFEVVSTIIGREYQFYNAADLLKSTVEELMSNYNMTEKEALRINAVSQLKDMLEGEMRNQQFGFELRDLSDIKCVASALGEEGKLLILSLNAKLRIVSFKHFSLSNDGAFNEIFRFLYCQPGTQFIAVIKEETISTQSKELATRLKELGKISGINMLDFVNYSETEFCSFNNNRRC